MHACMCVGMHVYVCAGCNVLCYVCVSPLYLTDGELETRLARFTLALQLQTIMHT